MSKKGDIVVSRGQLAEQKEVTKPNSPPSATTALRDHQIVWPQGRAFLRVKNDPHLKCVNSVRFDNFALGFAFQGIGSEMHWELEGRSVFDQRPDSPAVCQQLVVLPAGCEFHGVSCGAGECLWLTFCPELARTLFANTGFIIEPRVDGSWWEDRLAWLLASSIREECRRGGEHGLSYTEHLSYALAIRLANTLRCAKAPEDIRHAGLSASAVSRLVEYIDAHLERNITLTELARLVDLTPAYFCRAFKYAVGRPPHQYQLERRIERAKTYLREGKASISDIAVAVGFASQSHLNDHFRRHVGVTPGQFRTAHIGRCPDGLQAG